MGTRSTQALVAVAAAIVVAFGVAVAVIAIGGEEATASRADYQASVVNGRDRADFALEQITKSESPEELVERIDEAAAVVGDVADDLDGTGVAPGFEEDHDRLVEAMDGLSVELANTAAQFRDPSFTAALPGINSLSFPQWDAVNRVLADLKERGIDVTQLERH